MKLPLASKLKGNDFYGCGNITKIVTWTLIKKYQGPQRSSTPHLGTPSTPPWAQEPHFSLSWSCQSLSQQCWSSALSPASCPGLIPWTHVVILSLALSLFAPIGAPWRDVNASSLLTMSVAVDGPCYQALSLCTTFATCSMSPHGEWHGCQFPSLQEQPPLAASWQQRNFWCWRLILLLTEKNPAMLNDHFPGYLFKSSKGLPS